jgi:hypothetical protein
MGFTISGAALSRLVLTTDCAGANVEDLLPSYQEKSKPEIEDGIRWFYCGGLAVALFFTGKSYRRRLTTRQPGSPICSRNIRLSCSYPTTDSANSKARSTHLPNMYRTLLDFPTTGKEPKLSELDLYHDFNGTNDRYLRGLRSKLQDGEFLGL